MDIFNLDKLNIFLLFFVPGFISMKIWSSIVPSESRKPTDYLLEIISYSCLNFAFLSWLVIIVSKDEFKSNHESLFYLAVFSILFVFPIIWPIILNKLFQWPVINKFFIHPIPKAWDYYFSKRKPCYVLIHLKNGELIGGYLGGKSFASSFPNVEDIYLEQVWKVNKNGEFQNMIESTNGLWICKDNFNYIEFFQGKEEVS